MDSSEAEAEAGSAAAEPDESRWPDERHWRLTTEGERFVDAEGRTVRHAHRMCTACATHAHCTRTA